MTSGETLTRRDAEHHGLLGTVVQVTAVADSEGAASSMEAAVIAEIERLQSVFNVFDPSSQIRRWQQGEVPAGAEIEEVLALADDWRSRSNGAFDAHVGLLRRLWETAAATDRMPRESELVAAGATRSPLSADLNGIAKGWIVDRAVAAGVGVTGAVGITVNAGGDIRHESPQPLHVGVEDPNRPFDNVPPLQVVRLGRGALASSGGARRGWTIAGKWHSHVVDPRSGYPAGHVAQATVQAATACAADAIATALTVLALKERGDLLSAVDEPIGYLIVADDGTQVTNAVWETTRIS